MQRIILKKKPEPKKVKKNYSNSPFADKPTHTSPATNSKNKSLLSEQFLPDKKPVKQTGGSENFQSKKTEMNELKRKDENKSNLLNEYSTQKNIPPSVPIKINPLPKKESKEPEIVKKSTKKLNWKLLVTSIVIFIFALGSGFYYYLSITNEKNESSTLNQNESKPIEITTPETETIIETSNFSTVLSEAEIIELADNQTLKQTLANFKLETEQRTTNGIFYEISRSGEILTASQILQELEINIPGLNEKSKKGWFYIETNDSGETKKSLIMESNLSFVEIKNIILPIEKSLPSHLKNLYSPVLVLTNENIIFQTSDVDERFRYFNITEGDPAKSVDWGIINISKDEQENNLIIFSTSKTMTEKFVVSL